jgi:hypothetical protein
MTEAHTLPFYRRVGRFSALVIVTSDFARSPVMKPAPKKKRETKRKMALPAPRLAEGEEHLARVRHLCFSLPQTTEKISHGAPTFFVVKRVYAMFTNNHHNDGHIAVWLPAEPGVQAMLIRNEPGKYFRPPYVGVGGWIGVELTRVSDEELALHICEAWRIISQKQRRGKAQ